MILERIIVGFTEANCYIFGDKKEVLIIDPGADYKKIKDLIAKLGLVPKAVVNTHGHADHIGANKDFGLPVWIHKLDAGFLGNPDKNLSGLFGVVIKSPSAQRLLEDGDKLAVGALDLEVIHTPGHTPGSISLKHNNLIFTGDALFRGGVGRTDFLYGSEEDLLKSIRDKLLIHEGATIYPGHGPSSTIDWEKKNNPFLLYTD